jgi:hypothetical protein
VLCLVGATLSERIASGLGIRFFGVLAFLEGKMVQCVNTNSKIMQHEMT